MTVDVAFHHLRLPRKRFETSSGLRENAEVFVLEARHGAFSGIGAGSPATSVGDSPKKCGNALAYAKDLKIEPDSYFESDITDDLRSRSPAAAAALDIAMWDLRAKMQCMSLAELLGGEVESLPTDATVDLKRPDEARMDATRLAQEGFKCIKVKVGRILLEDLDRTRAVRDAVGPSVRLFVDANGGYDEEKARDFWESASELDLEFFEQPVPKDMVGELASLRESGVEICADESFADEDSLRRIIALEAADIVNLKLMKSGGLTQAIKLVKMAKEAGIDTMVGCMGDVGISIGAAAHLACCIGPRQVDLDSHLNIMQICDGPAVSDGEILLRDDPGLGIRLTADWRQWRV